MAKPVHLSADEVAGLRERLLRLAAEIPVEGIGGRADEIVATAKKFEAYVIGNGDE